MYTYKHMRFHVVSISKTQTTQEFINDAYTQKVRKFCNMMYDRGHTVFLYASDENEAHCSKLITCITRTEQENLLGMKGTTNASTSKPQDAHKGLRLFINNVTHGISNRITPGDFICVIGGSAYKELQDVFPNNKVVEFGIGYRNIFAKYKVFESYAWMNFCYGLRNISHEKEGKLFDTIIPNYYDIDEFPFSSTKEDYFLFIGRLIEAKGYSIAIEVAKSLGKRLIIAGAGTPPDYGEYRGVVGVKERGELMSKASAVFVPSLYNEPFGGVHVEAMLCGTPVITTDWGAFPENNIHGVTGYRCRSRQDFIDAAMNVSSLNYQKIREYALSKYSTSVVSEQYERYFLYLAESDSDPEWFAANQ